MHSSTIERRPNAIHGLGRTAIRQFLFAFAPLALASVTGCSAAPRQAHADPQARVPAKPIIAADVELSAFIEPGSHVRISRAADLDDDGDLDVIAVIANGTADAARTLLILKREPDGKLLRAVENPAAILPADRGGTMSSDPLRDLTADSGRFSLSFEGGSRELWSEQYSFEYSADRGTWLLTELKSNVLDRHEGTSQARTLTPRDFGEITAAEFDPDALAKD